MQVHNLGIRACPFPTNSYSNLNLKSIFPVEPQLEIRLKQVSKFKKHHLESIHPLKHHSKLFTAVSNLFQTPIGGPCQLGSKRCFGGPIHMMFSNVQTGSKWFQARLKLRSH